MAVIRQLNLLGQMRLDVPHLRSLESSIAADFDLLAGNIMAGQKALIVRGFDIDTSGVGQPATTLKLNVAGSILLHPLASEAGTIFAVDADAQPEVLSPANGSVSGSFIPSQDNFIGIDLRREADASTTDTVMFLDANTRLETPRSIPLARTLSYKIVVSTTDFAATPHVCPVAKVTLDNFGQVSAIADCRPMAYRLGAGGSLPDALHTYPWVQGRTPDAVGEFGRGDKSIGSEKDWRDAVMTRLWELGGGERWYSAASDRDFKLTFGQPVFGNGKNFEWDKITGILKWKSIAVVFANSTASVNTVKDNTVGKSMPDGHCLYVDIKRSAVAEVVADVASMSNLGTPSVPGSRVIIAWRKGEHVFVRDYPFEVDRDLTAIPPSTGEYAKALFQGTAAGTYVWKQVEPFVAGNVGQVQFDAGEGLGGSDSLFWDKDQKRLGIGTSTPSAPLHIKAASGDATIVLEADPTNPNTEESEAANPYILMKQDGGNTSSIIGHNQGFGSGTDETAADGSTVIGAINNALLLSTKSANHLQIGANNRVALTVDTAGNIGVGTPTPNTSLHLYKYQSVPADGTTVLNVESNANPNIRVSDTDGPIAHFGTYDQHGFVGTFSNSPFGIGTDNQDRIRITAAGDVGVGTTEPFTPFQVHRDSTLGNWQDKAVLRVSTNTHDTFIRTSGLYNDSRVETIVGSYNDWGFVGTSTENSFSIKTNNQRRLTIDSDGDVSIGSSVSIGLSLEVTSQIQGARLSAKGTGEIYQGDGLQGSSWLSWVRSFPQTGSQGKYSDLCFGQKQDRPNQTADISYNQGYLLRGYVSGIEGGPGAAMNDFTGQHRCVPDGIDIAEAKKMTGMICVSTGVYAKDGLPVRPKDVVSINESLPMVRLSAERMDKSVFGVISDAEDPDSSTRSYASGVFVSAYEKAENDTRLIINALGEGAIWVCDANGPLENGDYITTSEIPGHGMKQDDDLLHNYTVAKITMDCDFNPKNGEYEVVEFTHNGKKYKKAFVGCTYHCG